MNYRLLKKQLPSENTRLKGIYATKEAAEFIQSKLESRPEQGSVEYIIEPTEEPLKPESSHKVDKYLSTLSTNQPK
tara:strand:+ start:232 stop:459 length:228 start_codon:yes stop_codon:yes gene_type:complete